MRIKKLESILGRGNFNSSTAQQKDAMFNGRFKFPNRTALPSVAAVGELTFANNHFYVCKAANTWTLIT